MKILSIVNQMLATFSKQGSKADRAEAIALRRRLQGIEYAKPTRTTRRPRQSSRKAAP